MYSDNIVYQIVIALLKKYGIRHCVLSAGSRNVPFVHSVEEDDFFTCFSVVDERSAGYFALGLAQELQAPVVISCTSSTATCNYWPAVAEAYYQNVPLVVLTSDRNPHMLGQWEDQMIDQVGMYDRHVRKSVNLPVDAEDRDDFIFCQRLVNEALLELNHHVSGPVHINVPMKGYNMQFNTETLPEVTKIERLQWYEKDNGLWAQKIAQLKKAKRILITCGQKSFMSAELVRNLDSFFQKFNCAISVEYMANYTGDNAINTFLPFDSKLIDQTQFEKYLPEIVISFGGNIMSGTKDMLRRHEGKYEHWLIQEDGTVVDLFKSLTTIFECPVELFFEYCCQNAAPAQKNDFEYYNLIANYANGIQLPQSPFSSVYAIQNMVERIPSDSILHLSINDSIRITNFCKVDPSVRVYANIGTYGIDGCLSSFIGQAYAHKGPSYLVIGDLSFFYDMNALRIKHLSSNARILLINNQGGGEFYYNGSWVNEASDLHTTARHHNNAKGWVESLGFRYLSANDMESFDACLDTFMDNNCNEPILLEVFTEMKHDAESIYKIYYHNKSESEKLIHNTKQKIKELMGEKMVKALKKTHKKTT